VKGEIIIWENRRGLETVGDLIISISFITVQHSLWTLIPLMLRTRYQIKKSFPSAKFFSLRRYRNDEWKTGHAVKDMPGFEIKMSLVHPLTRLKKICMALELNRKGERTSDIDVHVYNQKTRKLGKISRSLLI
jgi:phosphoribosyl-dephospho-CoA transferase